jgi:hypothetical protein
MLGIDSDADCYNYTAAEYYSRTPNYCERDRDRERATRFGKSGNE